MPLAEVDLQHWDDLDRLLGLIHDHDLDLSGVRYDGTNQTWSIPCSSALSTACVSLTRFLRLVLRGGRHERRHPPAFDRILTISGVRGWEARDRARIQWYTMNTIKFDRKRSRLVLHLCEDCRILLDVEPQFALLLEDVGQLA